MSTLKGKIKELQEKLIIYMILLILKIILSEHLMFLHNTKK